MNRLIRDVAAVVLALVALGAAVALVAVLVITGGWGPLALLGLGGVAGVLSRVMGRYDPESAPPVPGDVPADDLRNRAPSG